MMHCKIIGEGKTTLVLLHGFCENNTCFNEQVLLFKDHCKIILPDLPGFGLSKLKHEMSLAQMAEELKNLLEFLKVKNCIMLGHSMGGYLTLSFAKQYPEMLKGFGLIHSTAFADSEERKEKRNQVIGFIEKFGKEKYIENFIPGLFTEENQKKSIANTAIQSALTSSSEGIINAAKAMRDREDTSQVLVQTELPIFFGIGKNDPIIAHEVMLGQAALCKIAFIGLYHKSSHMAMAEEPDTLAHDILKYLKRFELI
jgi:pimeloyl-ACP methyl ester carboxylesterase